LTVEIKILFLYTCFTIKNITISYKQTHMYIRMYKCVTGWSKLQSDVISEINSNTKFSAYISLDAQIGILSSAFCLYTNKLSE